MIPKGSTVIYRTEKLGENPTVDGALRAAREVVPAAGAKVGELAIGTSPGQGAPAFGPRDACKIVGKATLQRLAVSSTPHPIPITNVDENAAGNICVWDDDNQLDIDTGILPDTVKDDGDVIAHRGYLQQYHHVREGLSLSDTERTTLTFRRSPTSATRPSRTPTRPTPCGAPATVSNSAP